MKISIHRIFPLAGLFLAAGLFVGGSALTSPEVDAAKPCKRTKFTFPRVEAACKNGGYKAAKKLMKKVVKASRKAGDERTCLDCHKDLKSLKSTKNAKADLKKLLPQVK